MLASTYIAYIAISLGLTFWVGRTLNKNGKVFLSNQYDADLVEAISNMLLVGFYLINIGFISYTLRIAGEGPGNTAEAIEFLSMKIGLIAIVLGVMHFGLMIVLQKYANVVKSIPLPRAESPQIPNQATIDTGTRYLSQ